MDIYNPKLIAYSKTLFFYTSLFTKPQSYAYFPLTYLPVKTISLALFNPTIELNLIVPPSINGTPTLLQNTPKLAYGWDTIISHHNASYNPPATQYPVTAAIIGFDGNSLVGPIGPLPSALGNHSWITYDVS